MRSENSKHKYSTSISFCVNLLMKFPTRHPNLNSLWSALLLEELWRLGVEHVCIAPGSRSAPLTLAAAVHPHLQQHVHFDERGLAFFALGLAKSSGRPVAVITTSGTAVPNLYPAIVEARQSGVPLVIITADRPPELIDCGANQAIEQQDIFSGYPGATIRLPTPSLDIPANWLLTSIDQAYARSCRQGLPLHINCMFREPLYPYKSDEDYSLYLAETTRWTESDAAHTEYELHGDGGLNASPVPWSEFMSGKGLVVVGRLRTSDDVEAVLALAQRLGWPVLADIQSQLHGHPAVIPHCDLLLSSRSGRALMCQADRVFQIGGHLISKRLDRFLGSHRWQHYYMLGREIRRMDTGHSQTYRMVGNIGRICHQLAQLHSASDAPLLPDWLEAFRMLGQKVSTVVRHQQVEELSESWIGTHLSALLPEEASLFIGNSLPIRLMDMFSAHRSYGVYTNRGASGIDGLVATAAGCCVATKKPLVLLVGDISFLHDLNSLQLVRQLDVPMLIVLLNNDGGGIFNLLPLAKGDSAIKHQAIDYFTTPHGLDARYAAAMFGIEYRCPESTAAFKEAVELSLQSPGCTLLEVKTAPGEAACDISQIITRVEEL
ncbi:2-succinyl-5-enolpyruvyl-6-hydroxy-3-cyclohexene-1-carboxylate synthase [Endozoicomonas montiporae CL-33]|nr:2-succinyl-5-enolpyruvyl-6-hydroxy-3-cyclohexene-1-carboxylate synthase [Endozoicomonas montiporae CL-33]